jgi:hypothetical protein
VTVFSAETIALVKAGKGKPIILEVACCNCDESRGHTWLPKYNQDTMLRVDSGRMPNEQFDEIRAWCPAMSERTL